MLKDMIECVRGQMFISSQMSLLRGTRSLMCVELSGTRSMISNGGTTERVNTEAHAEFLEELAVRARSLSTHWSAGGVAEFEAFVKDAIRRNR